MTIHQHRRRVEHVCPVCGKSFAGLVTARTCSDTCRQKAHRKSKQERT